jgi:hypothetical protein
MNIMRHNWLILNKIHNAGRYVLLFNEFSPIFPSRIGKYLVRAGCFMFAPLLKYRRPRLVAKQSP